MKHLIEWRLFESSKEEDIESICREYNIENWTLNEDGSIDVDGDVDLSFKKLTKLPLKFRNVSGYFNCSENNLISLDDCPESVGSDFNCSYNKLTSLEGSPKSVGGDFDCSINNIISLEGAPESIRGQFYCERNPVKQIWDLFKNKYKIEFFNDLDIIKGKSIVLDKLIYFLDTIGKPRTEEELRKLIEYYTFI
jgi:hypothetical protein